MLWRARRELADPGSLEEALAVRDAPSAAAVLGHIPGGGRQLLREGALISYQPRPEATSPPDAPSAAAVLWGCVTGLKGVGCRV